MISDWADLPPKVIDVLRTNHLRITPFASAEWLWDRVFTDQERRRLGGKLEESFTNLGTVRMWQEVRGGSQVRAIIDGAFAMTFIDQATRDWLIREIGEKPAKSRESMNKPVWDAREGELRLSGQVIRRVRVRGKKTNIQVILDAFQKRKWIYQIANPLKIVYPLNYGQEQLHQALRSLNAGLRGIRFRAHRGAEFISWEVI